MLTTALFPRALIGLLGWGALAFGAEYSWAYAPLLVFAVAVAGLGIHASRGAVAVLPRTLTMAMAAVLASPVVQLVPLPSHVVEQISPGATRVDYSQLYADSAMRPRKNISEGHVDRRPLSIEPSRTVLGIAFLGVFLFLLYGTIRGFSGTGITTVARGIVALAVLVALLGIFQTASSDGTVLGLWTPPKSTNPFAPLINRDHFCGWMLMAISVSIGHLAGQWAMAMRRVGPEWRRRLVWVSTPEASEAVLTSFAIIVMALSIILSASRSGLLCLVFVLMASSLCAFRQSSRQRRVLFAAYLVAAAVAASSWGSIDVVLRRFDRTAADAQVRMQVWQDTLRIAEDFPFVGTGLNTFGVAMLRYQTAGQDERFVESHNDYLQLVAEGGLLLIVPAGLVLVAIFIGCRRSFKCAVDGSPTYWLKVGAVIGLCAIAVQEAVDFTLQMPGVTVLFVTLLGIALCRPISGRAEFLATD